MTQEIESAIDASPRAAQVATPLYWHGDFGGVHSLAHVNDQIARALSNLGGFSIERRPAVPSSARESAAPAAPGIDVTHCWPPRLAPPGSRPWIAFQPWEFGSMPVEWLSPLRDRAADVWVYSAVNKRAYVADGIPDDRVAVIPLGVDCDRFAPDAAPSARVLRGTGKSFRFLFVGGTIHRKGIDVLLRAWASAFKRDDDVCLVIKDFCRKSAYQGQTNEDSIRALAADPAAGEILYVTEDLNPAEIPGLYAACDVLVHPYRGEGFGLPVAEAMASGLPVIVTRGGPCDEFCPPDAGIFVSAARHDLKGTHKLVRTGYLLDPSAQELAAMMRLAVAHKERMRELGARGREAALSRLTWQHTARAAADRLAVVLDRVSGPARPAGPRASSG